MLRGDDFFSEHWKDVDVMHLLAYFGILILAGVYRSTGQLTKSLWGSLGKCLELQCL